MAGELLGLHHARQAPLADDPGGILSNVATGAHRGADAAAAQVQANRATSTLAAITLIAEANDQSIFALGGELVVEYAIEVKRIFGAEAFVMGYSNDVMAYIPSSTILQEGGYEGKTSQMVYGLPATWSSNIQTAIFYEIVRLAEQAGVPRIQHR